MNVTKIPDPSLIIIYKNSDFKISSLIKGQQSSLLCKCWQALAIAGAEYCRLLCCVAVLSVLLYPAALNAQTVSAREWYGDAKSLAMGDALLISQLIFSEAVFQKQQDKILSVQRAQASCYVPFARTSLAVTGLFFQVQSPLADFQLNLGRSGTEVYNENLISLGCARSLTESLSGGFRLGLYRFAGSQLSAGTALLTECYVYYLINQQWRLGAYMFNPIAARAAGIALIQSYHLACAYRPDPRLDFVLEIEKPQRQDLLVHMGMEAAFLKCLRCRLGLNYPLMQPSLGLACTWKKFSLEAACRLHKQLPASYAVSLHYTP
ncbi:MAG: hypothetical protein PHE04_00105 [Bacteroidales bacterium]|nr:hypothetical protein [Bacteroidales bacterium]MDD3430412.1 hypothetical protein [Bacteroidales bacterium]MDD4361073.1 hypothetical protein [Bacteroidales bacterium]MDD4429883.1 hypothetical protein [Bacteroidales bacterium]